MNTQPSSSNLIHDFNAPGGSGVQRSGKDLSYVQFAIILVVFLVAGLGAGLLVSRFTAKQSASTTSNTTNAPVAQTAGIADKKTFKDKAEGILRNGGIDGEGNFHLDRPGGPSQNVYLTSTTVDLTKYIGKKVRVWGETFQAQKAGWLMDVGLVEVLQ